MLVGMAPKSPPPTSGEAIRALRTRAGISARTLASKAHMSHGHLLRFEHGERQLPPETLARIIAALADLAVGA